MNPFYQSGGRYRLPDGSVGSFERHSVFGGSAFFVVQPVERSGQVVPVEEVGDRAVEVR